MARTIVCVLRGGTSSEYDLSLKTGNTVLASAPESDFDMRDMLIDRAGYWHARGRSVAPARALHQVDVVFNALHGGIGEDGTVQRLLETLSVPYTFSRAHPSALSLNKIQATAALIAAGIRMPRSIGFTAREETDSADMARLVFEYFGPPYVVKPAHEGASHGILIAETIIELPYRIADTLEAFGSAVVEEFIVGDDATVGIIQDFRGESLYALPPARVEHPESTHIHFDHHRGGHLTYTVPSDFSHGEKAALIDMARRAHSALGLRHASRADFIVSPRGPYLLEVNSTPGLHDASAFPHMLQSVGSSVGDFISHVVGLSQK